MKSVACDYESETAEHRFETVRTEPAILEDLVRCPSRRKIAIVAVARRRLIWCWAMKRDDKDWNPRALETA